MLTLSIKRPLKDDRGHISKINVWFGVEIVPFVQCRYTECRGAIFKQFTKKPFFKKRFSFAPFGFRQLTQLHFLTSFLFYETFLPP